MKTTSKRWRQTAVWLHVITSVGWMSQALALFVLMVVNLSSSDVSLRISATSMAHVLDTSLLAPLANASAFTGFMLAASTAWGFFRYWWVLAKFAITIVQLYAGIFLLSDALEDSVAGARTNTMAPLPQVAGTALMAGAIAFQAWLSVAKPWRRTPWTTDGGKPAPTLPTAPTWVFVTTVLAPLADIAIGTVLGLPLPILSLVVLASRLVGRCRQVRRTRGEVNPAARKNAASSSTTRW